MIGLLAAVAAAAMIATTAPSAGAASTSSDVKIAKQGVIVAGDLPASWTSEPYDSSGDKQTEKIAATIPACKQFLAFSNANKSTPRAKSEDFSLDSATISNNSNVYTSTAKALVAMKAVGASAVPGCLNKLFQKAVQQEIAKDSSSSETVSALQLAINRVSGVGGSGGDQTVAYEGNIDISMKDGTSQSLDVGVAAVRVGRAVLVYSYSSPAGSDVTAALEPAVGATMARTKAALK